MNATRRGFLASVAALCLPFRTPTIETPPAEFLMRLHHQPFKPGERSRFVVERFFPRVLLRSKPSVISKAWDSWEDEMERRYPVPSGCYWMRVAEWQIP